MNGSIEIDKDRYPYAAQRRGDSYKVTHVPTQEVLLDVVFPAQVGERIAANINAEYYKNGPSAVHGQVRIIARSVIGRMHVEGDLDANTLNQLRQKLA